MDFVKIRNYKGYKQEELAEMAGVSIKTVYHFECPNKIVSKESACRILNALNLDIKYEDYYKARKKSHEFYEEIGKKLAQADELYAQQKDREAIAIYRTLIAYLLDENNKHFTIYSNLPLKIYDLENYQSTNNHLYKNNCENKTS